MARCSECGREPLPDGSGNAEREIIIRVPERHIALFRKMFRDMETRLGMHGLGELAHELRHYGEAFRPEVAHMRQFDDGALALCMTGISRGFSGTVRIGPSVGVFRRDTERHEVYVDFAFPDGRVRSLRVAEGATSEAAEWFKDYFIDIMERLRPDPVSAPDPAPSV